MCDIGGAAMGHLRGTWHIRPTEALKYYDTIYHMRRYDGKVKLMAGLGDYVCPPSGVAALYNGISAPKKIVWKQGRTHAYSPRNAETFVQEAE